MSVELKIKAKHLALEPAIIRKEEQKIKRQLKWMRQNLQVNHDNLTSWCAKPTTEHETAYRKLNNTLMSLLNHRGRGSLLRAEARATHLARAFLAGKPYKSVERSTKESEFCHYTLKRIAKMVTKYDVRNRRSEEANLHLIKAWIVM